MAKKTLTTNTADDYASDKTEQERKSEIQSEHVYEDYFEGGRLKASMLVRMGARKSSQREG